MARLVGVDLPRNKRMEVALTYIYGIGPTRAKKILAATGISPDLRTDDLTDDDIKAINNAGNCVIIYNSAGRDIAGNPGVNQVKIDPAKLAKITNKNLLFSDTTGYNYVNKDQFNDNMHKDLTLHSAHDLWLIQNNLSVIEENVKNDNSLNDLDKALFTFLKFTDIFQYEYQNQDTSDHVFDDNGRDYLRSLACVLNHKYGKTAVCAGIALAYTKVLKELGVDCEFVEKPGDHAWVNIKIKDARGNERIIPIDPTWAVNAAENKNYTMRHVLLHFGLNPDFYEPDRISGNNHHGIPESERILDANGKAVTLSKDEVKTSYQKIQKKLYSKEIKMQKNTAVPAEMGELHFAIHPDIASRGLGFTGYILHLKKPDGSIEMKLIYADNGVDMSACTWDEIQDALNNKQGFIDDKNTDYRARKTYEELCDTSKNDELFARTDILDGNKAIAMSIATGTQFGSYTDVDSGGGVGAPVMRVNRVENTLIASLTPEQLTNMARQGEIPSRTNAEMQQREAEVMAM